MSIVADRLGPMREVAAQAHARVNRRLDILRDDLAGDVSGLRILLGEARDLWAAVCREVIAGRTEQAHTDRGRLKQTIDESLAAIRDWLRLARDVAGVAGREPGGTAVLLADADEAERFWSRLFGRWNTPEDLEDLVANTTAPTREQLDSITQKYGFPYAWHAADDSPV